MKERTLLDVIHSVGISFGSASADGRSFIPHDARIPDTCGQITSRTNWRYVSMTGTRESRLAEFTTRSLRDGNEAWHRAHVWQLSPTSV